MEKILRGGFKELQEKKEIPIEWDGKPDKVVIRKIDRATMREIRSQSHKERAIGKTIQTELNSELYRDLMVTRAVESAPWKVGAMEEVGRLPPNFVDDLFVIIMEFNELTDEKKQADVGSPEQAGGSVGAGDSGDIPAGKARDKS